MSDLTKFAALALAAMMAATALVFIPEDVKAADTSNDWFAAIPGAPVNTFFYDVAWSDDGKLACFVGWTYIPSSMGLIYFYEPAGDVWTKATMPGGADVYTYPMRTVTYCPNAWDGPKFLVAGTGGASGDVYWAYGPGVDVQWSTSSMFANVDVWDSAYNPAIGSMGSLYLCGNTATELRMVEIVLSSGAFNMKSSLALATHCWRGIEVDPVSNDLYMVGNGAGGSLYHRFRYSDSTTFPLTFPYGTSVSDIIFDSHHAPNRMIAVCEYQNIGDVTSVYQITKGADSYDVVTPIGRSSSYTYFSAIDMDSDGHAVLVGMNDELATEGDVWDLWDDDSGYTHLLERSTSMAPFASEQFMGVAIRPTGVQMALIAGSAFKYSYTSVVGPIQVDTGVPHFNYIDIYPLGGATADSVINGQVDVDIGDGNTQYVLEAEIYDPLGVARMTIVEAWLWYDNGVAPGTDVPSAMGAGFDAAGGENLRMHYAVHSDNSLWQYYPVFTGTEEATLAGGDWNVINATSATIRLIFSPHQQVRWAAGPFGEAAGDRYGAGAEGQSTLTALNGANTWDIKLSVRDDAPTPNYAYAYDEFGFYRYTYLGTSGLPNGGAVYGSGAPGTNDVAMSVSGSDVTFCANCPYEISIGLAGNLQGVAFPINSIGADQVYFMGGTTGVYWPFPSGGGTQTIIAGLYPPLDSGRVTTTSTFDGNPDSQAVYWEVDIPGVPEDSYLSTVTWAITN